MDVSETRILQIAVAVSVFLVIIIVTFVLSLFRQQKKFAMEKMNAGIQASEKEKKRLASDLHDDLGPVLATTKIYVNSLSQTTDEDRRLVEHINKYLDNGIDTIRQIANNLSPKLLERAGLKKALQSYIYTLESYVPFAIHYFFPENEPELSKEAELGIYRIVQEILTNIIKHSQAKNVQLNFEVDHHTFGIFIGDDGTGFNYNDYNFESTGNGIANIRSRVDVLSGKCTILTQSGEGVRYEIKIPLLKNKPH